MQGRNITQALLLALGLSVALDAAAQGATTAPVFGGWRNLHSANGVEPAQDDLAFAMLPTTAAKGTRFAILDREAKRVVCCMVVSSDRLDAGVLETQYRLPGVWVSDLLNEGNDTPPPYEPRVYEMKRDGALATYVFHDAIEAYSDLGGLLLPRAPASMPPARSRPAPAATRCSSSRPPSPMRMARWTASRCARWDRPAPPWWLKFLTPPTDSVGGTLTWF